MEEKVSILILNHGRFGEELIKSAQLIVGKVENIMAVSLLSGMSIEEYYECVKEAITSLMGETLILTDLYGGTPSNVAMMLGRVYNLRSVCGVNLPMLIELLLLRSNSEYNIGELITSIVETGKNAVFAPEQINVEPE